MRVLQVINSLEIAGAEVMLGDLVPRLADLGIGVSVAVFRRFGSRLEKALEEVSQVHYVSAGGRRSPASVFPLLPLCRRVDIVHSHLFPAQLWTAAAARLTPSPTRFVTTEHNPDNYRRGKSAWGWIDRWMYMSYDRIACNSQATADALQRWVPDTSTISTVIPNGIAIEKFKARTQRNGQLRSQPVAIFVARLEPQKDHATLLRAIAGIPGVRLRLVGDGSLRRQLEALALELRIADRVEFLGFRDNVAELLFSSDVYVHATHSDGFGISAVEAMAAGLPVVATAVPGLDWVVGDAGLTCPPNDVEALRSAMSRVLGDHSLRQQMIVRGTARAQQFTVEAMVDAYARLYDGLMTTPEKAIRHAASH